jgi:hypothetical protein
MRTFWGWISWLETLSRPWAVTWALQEDKPSTVAGTRARALRLGIGVVATEVASTVKTIAVKEAMMSGTATGRGF